MVDLHKWRKIRLPPNQSLSQFTMKSQTVMEIHFRPLDLGTSEHAFNVGLSPEQRPIDNICVNVNNLPNKFTLVKQPNRLIMLLTEDRKCTPKLSIAFFLCEKYRIISFY